MTSRPRLHSLTALIQRGVLTLAAGLLLGCAGTQVPPDQITSPGQSLFNGRVKEDVNCYKCHNGDGSGTLRGPNLAKKVPGLTDDEIRKTILEGPGLMPSFKGKVTDADIADITAWLRKQFPK